MTATIAQKHNQDAAQKFTGEILIVANVSRSNKGGGWPHVRGLARGLRELQLPYTLLCGGEDAQSSDADFERIIARQAPQQPVLWRLGPIASLRFWQHEIKAAAQGCDAVIALSAGMAVAAKKALDRPVIYAPAILSAVEHPEWWLHKQVERWAYRRSDGVLLTTPDVQSTVEHIYGSIPGNVAIAPLGIDTDKLRHGDDPRAAYGIPANTHVLLTVGAINENKGQAIITRALAACAASAAETTSDWWWVVLGDGPDRTALEAAVCSSALRERIIFAGHATELGAWYRTADALVAASRHETFGLAIAEALSAGLPVVIPRNEPPYVLSPLASVVRSQRLGALFSRQSVTELSTALQMVLNDPDIAASGERAQRWARQALHWPAYAQAALDLIQAT